MFVSPIKKGRINCSRISVTISVILMSSRSLRLSSLTLGVLLVDHVVDERHSRLSSPTLYPLLLVESELL